MAARRVSPNAENASSEDLRRAVRASRSLREMDRLQAIVALIEGADRALVAKIHFVTERTLRRWVRAFNERGIDGLLEEPHPGRPRKIPPDQAPALCDLIEHPEKAGQVHWTGVKFHGHLRERLAIEVGYSTVIRFFHERGYRLKVPQPWPDRQDEAAREAFCERLRAWADDEAVEIWFGDEMGIEGDPRPRRRWAKRGEKTRVTKNGDHMRMNVTGILCPRTGEAYALEFSHSDLITFQAFLNEANRDLAFERPRQLLIVDNASWHRCKSLDWGRFEPVFLPPYSPDLNPIERLWLLVKAEWFYDFVAKTKDDLIARLDKALCWAMGRGAANAKTCVMRTEI